MHVYLIAGAAVWGIASGLLVPRATYRLAVPADEPWAATCPAGHPIRGWLGPARCPACTVSARMSPVPGREAALGPEVVPGREAAPASGPGSVSASAPSPASSPASAPGPAPTPTSAPAPTYGPRYAPAFGCALASAALALTTGAHPELVVWLLLVPVGLVLASVDLRVFRLPDVLTLPALAGTAVLLGPAALLPSHDGSWVRALLAAAALGILYLLMFLINPAGMGFGDVKLAPTLGLVLGWYGWPAVVGGTFAGLLLGALAGLTLIALRRADRRTPIPFGPFMLVGALAALLAAS